MELKIINDKEPGIQAENNDVAVSVTGYGSSSSSEEGSELIGNKTD